MIFILILVKQNFMYAVKGNLIYLKILIPQFCLTVNSRIWVFLSGFKVFSMTLSSLEFNL